MSDKDPLGIVGATVAERYWIERFVAEGGFAVIYRAIHTVWNKPVAIKLFSALSLTSGDFREQLEQAFVNEGALLTELSAQTAAIVQCRDIGALVTPRGEWMPYLVLEWVDGVSLDVILDAEHAASAPPWPIEEVHRFLSSAASAVDVVHRRGVAHRDLKPANLLVVGGNAHAPDAAVKILDFGVAKMMLDNKSVKSALGATGKTVTAFTPFYGAPEQFSRRHGATGPWTDVYAFALIATEMLCGREPLQGRDVAELSVASCDPNRRPTPRTLGADVSDAVEAVFLKALSVAPEGRYSRAGEFWSALHEAITASPAPPASTPNSSVAEQRAAPLSLSSAKPRTLVTLVAAVGVLVVASIGLGAWLTARSAKKKMAPERAMQASRVDALGPPSALPAGAANAPEAPAIAAKKGAGTCPPEMLKIPKARFFAGSDREDALPVEKPSHAVALSAYCIDRYEVSVVAYKTCVDAGNCREAPREPHWLGIRKKDRIVFSPLCNAGSVDRIDHPLNCVDWKLADAYCRANDKRLPSEAEWEYAARGMVLHRYAWGDEEPNVRRVNACNDECQRWSKRTDMGFKALSSGSDGFVHTSPVEGFAAGRSGFGLYHMAGNVKEWVSDLYAPYAGAKAPPGAAPGRERVVRGGSWLSTTKEELRYTFRESLSPDVRRAEVGFRCAKSLED